MLIKSDFPALYSLITQRQLRRDIAKHGVFGANKSLKASQSSVTHTQRRVGRYRQRYSKCEEEGEKKEEAEQ